MERRSDATLRRLAQQRLDQTDSELNELYRLVREKEKERAEYDRIVHPEDYGKSDQ